MPNATLFQHDFTQGLPAFPFGKTFDFIVCTYAIHHLGNSQKIKFIKELIDHLSVCGKVLIGDVAFETTKEMEKCKAQNSSDWDNDEIYPVAEVMMPAFPSMKFEKISFCAGVLIVAK
jgi:putative AdoMet-dependent methyltransferase